MCYDCKLENSQLEPNGIDVNNKQISKTDPTQSDLKGPEIPNMEQFKREIKQSELICTNK